jgi:hypothetical protein
MSTPIHGDTTCDGAQAAHHPSSESSRRRRASRASVRSAPSAIPSGSTASAGSSSSSSDELSSAAGGPPFLDRSTGTRCPKEREKSTATAAARAGGRLVSRRPPYMPTMSELNASPGDGPVEAERRVCAPTLATARATAVAMTAISDAAFTALPAARTHADASRAPTSCSATAPYAQRDSATNTRTVLKHAAEVRPREARSTATAVLSAMCRPPGLSNSDATAPASAPQADAASAIGSAVSASRSDQNSARPTQSPKDGTGADEIGS